MDGFEDDYYDEEDIQETDRILADYYYNENQRLKSLLMQQDMTISQLSDELSQLRSQFNINDCKVCSIKFQVRTGEIWKTKCSRCYDKSRIVPPQTQITRYFGKE